MASFNQKVYERSYYIIPSATKFPSKNEIFFDAAKGELYVFGAVFLTVLICLFTGTLISNPKKFFLWHIILPLSLITLQWTLGLAYDLPLLKYIRPLAAVIVIGSTNV